MTRQQKIIWNPLFVAFQPRHLIWLMWSALILLTVNFELGEASAYMIGFTVGFSFVQAGFLWGEYQTRWWRFFLENRAAIHDSATSNKPTKKNALRYMIAVFAKNSYAPTFITVLSILMYAAQEWLGDWFGLWLSLCIASAISGITAFIVTGRLIQWGTETARSMTNFAYVLDHEPEPL